MSRKSQIRSFVKQGTGLGLAKKLRKQFEEAGYHAMPIDEYSSAIRSGRFPSGTVVFAVVDRGPPAHFPGSVIVTSDGEVYAEGDENGELRSVLEQ